MTARLPVIVGVGEICDQPADIAQSLEPIALMAEALRRAEQDANAKLLHKLDSLDIVHQASWRYDKTAARLCARLDVQPPRAVYGVTGGESPIRYLHEAALRIARGESEIAAVVGAEAQYAVNKAKAQNVALPWTPLANTVENPFDAQGCFNPIAVAHGAMPPIQVYPFYENATHAAWGQSPREALEESGEIWSRFSAVAAENPYAWSRHRYSNEEIITPSPSNRLICYPYTKHMVANPAVNQGAAVIVTTLERARALGIDESRLLFIWGGAAAHEPRDYLQRDQYARSAAQEVVLQAMQALAERNHGALKAIELYSCFPCVPKMTRRVLRLPDDAALTVTGGLSLFGAPLNNYMTHAVCAMTRHLRAGLAETGLLYGQGEFVTKHHALVVARNAPGDSLDTQYSLQTEVDRRHGPVPPLAKDYKGRATLETFTVVYDHAGEPLHGTVIARAAEQRIMARVPASDRQTLAALTHPEKTPVGLTGDVFAEGPLLQWRQ